MNQSIICAVTLLLLFLQSSCNANAPKDLPCERKCGSRKIAGGKIRVVPLADSFSIECDPKTTGAIGTFEYNFLVFEDRSTASSKDTSSTTSTGLTSQTPERVPLGGAAIYPSILGVTKAGIAGKGTDTNAEDWCTDSCGIATLQVTPMCVKGDLKVGIVVPGNTGEALNSTGNPNAAIVTTITNP